MPINHSFFMSEFSKKLKNEYANAYGNEYAVKNKGVANGT